MATGGLDFGSNSEEEKFTCPVCLEIFESPISIPCGHTFCIDCLYSSENASGKSRCPVCRTYFQPHQKSKARFIEQQIFQSISTCPGCYRQFPMSRLRAHRAACPQMSADLSFSPIASTRQSFPEAKNRSTFACPYCNTRNMDCKSLLQHVNNYHKGETQSVVCPICASMPWGNPNQSSANFVEHINLRHKFEYDTFVDYENEEDTVLKQVLAKSMQDW